MKRILMPVIVFVLAVCLCCGSACAETYTNQGFYVEFNGNSMNTNVSGSQLSEAFTSLEPGDDAYFDITLVNNCGFETYWYMYNKARETLEEIRTSAAGGNYTYRLTYMRSDGTEKVLYDSDRVGGSGSNKYGEDSNTDLTGLNQINSNLKEYFYLDAFKARQRGVISLHVALDGESQGNDYQNTEGILQFQFAVEKPGNSTTTLYSDRPKTADDSSLLLWACVSVASLALLAEIKMMKKRNRMMPFLLACLITAGIFAQGTEAFAAKEYNYKIKVYSGKIVQLDFDSEEYPYNESVNLNSYLDAAKAELAKDANSKYYVRGIRLSGRDNIQDDISPVITVKQDADYCISYGVKGNLTKYTIVYETVSGTVLGTEEYYGNVGDKPVVAYRYFDGYNPRVLALTQTLKEDSSKNIFTFQYTPVVVNTTTTGVETGNGGTGGNNNQGNGAGAQNAQGNAAGNQAGNEAAGENGANDVLPDDQTAADEIRAAAQQGNETPAEQVPSVAQQPVATAEPVVNPAPTEAPPVPTFNPDAYATAEPVELIDLDEMDANAAFSIQDVAVPLGMLQERADAGDRSAKIAITVKYALFAFLVLLLGGGIAFFIIRSNSRRAMAMAVQESQIHNISDSGYPYRDMDYDPESFNVDDLFNRRS